MVIDPRAKDICRALNEASGGRFNEQTCDKIAEFSTRVLNHVASCLECGKAAGKGDLWRSRCPEFAKLDNEARAMAAAA